MNSITISEFGHPLCIGAFFEFYHLCLGGARILKFEKKCIKRFVNLLFCNFFVSLEHFWVIFYCVIKVEHVILSQRFKVQCFFTSCAFEPLEHFSEKSI